MESLSYFLQKELKFLLAGLVGLMFRSGNLVMSAVAERNKSPQGEDTLSLREICFQNPP